MVVLVVMLLEGSSGCCDTLVMEVVGGDSFGWEFFWW